jgi:hypothetical protein
MVEYRFNRSFERSSMSSWDDPEFRTAIEAAGKNILMTGLWMEFVEPTSCCHLSPFRTQ